MRGPDIAVTERARKLRQEAPSAERILWRALRDRRFAAHKFVRQCSIGPFYADFLCRGKKLIIEVDGATHSTDEQISYDARREAYLRKHGYRLVRVGNTDVYENLEGVLATILVALEAPQTQSRPVPSPRA